MVSMWAEKLDRAFEKYRDVVPASYMTQFPKLISTLEKTADTMLHDDWHTLLQTLRSLDELPLLGKHMPVLLLRYVERRYDGLTVWLYSTLLEWQDRWSEDEYDAITAALLAHWQDSTAQYNPPDTLGVSLEEVSFLLLWLRDLTAVEPALLQILQRVMWEQEHPEHASLGSSLWADYIEELRYRPLDTLLAYATTGMLSKSDLRLDTRVLGFLQRAQILRG